jgi:DmsE family decaheme c-type cytochrome
MRRSVPILLRISLLALYALVLGLVGVVPVRAEINRSLDGDKKCTLCHNEASGHVLSIYQTKHGVKGDSQTPGCQGCHGESVKHQENPSETPEIVFGAKSKQLSSTEARSEVCLSCHESSVHARTYWSGSAHEKQGVTCTDCHEMHNPEQKVLNKLTQPEVCFGCHQNERAQFHRFSRHPILEGKVSCSDCHNPHGSTGPRLMVKNTINETCYTCHSEKRGPFLWEHTPVVEDCTNCHSPHGSNVTPLLKTRAPMLCQECHTSDHAKGLYSAANLPGGTFVTGNGTIPLGGQSPTDQANGRACLQCHSLIHGSNHPAGAKYNR